jgi:ABC-type spermidine/putrescine transport system permease subunit II
LPLYVFSSLRFGISPIVNATATIMLALTLGAVVLAYVVLRRTASAERRGGVVPGI